jgi:hypothetical protein
MPPTPHRSYSGVSGFLSVPIRSRLLPKRTKTEVEEQQKNKKEFQCACEKERVLSQRCGQRKAQQCMQDETIEGKRINLD